MKRVACVILMLVSIAVLGQNEVNDLRPYRLGLKIGAPNGCQFRI